MGQAIPHITQSDCFDSVPQVVCAGLTRTIATVMFTDIEDSTGLAKTLGVTAIAAFLKRHLSLVQDVIESHEGTVLGHNGDGIFAFWDNAMPHCGDAAVLALSAAAQLAETIAEDNARRCALGLPTRRVRVGLNSGEVALEWPDRREAVPRLYGATVHEARRIEQAGKRVKNLGGDVIIMASQATLQFAGFELAARYDNKCSASFCQRLYRNGAILLGNDMQNAARDCSAAPVEPRVIASILSGQDAC